MATATSIGTTAFKGLKTPREILQYNLMRGVTDFSNLEQFDMYEKGYPFLIVVKAPDFLMDLADLDPTGIGRIVKNFIHVLENDFRGIDNIDGITGETNGEITNGIRSISLINKVTKPSNSTFTLNVFERSGSLITKAIELYLTGIKDPETQAKLYHGLVDRFMFYGWNSARGSAADPGPHRECWTFLYFVTDNTILKIEKAFLITAAQPTVADFANMYAVQKGQIEFVDLAMNFNGFFISNDMVSMKAQKALLTMRHPENLTGSRIIVDSNNFVYQGIKDINSNINLQDNAGGKANTLSAWWDSEGKVSANRDNFSDLTNGYRTGSMNTFMSNDASGAYIDTLNDMNSIGGEHFIKPSQSAEGKSRSSHLMNNSGR